MRKLKIALGETAIKEILVRNGIPPSPKRRQEVRWRDFIKDHMHNTAATGFFTVEAITPRALVTYCVLFFLHHASRRVHLAGITTNPDEPWMKQIARNETMEGVGFLNEVKYVIHDRDGKYCPAFDGILKSAGKKPVKLPARSPNLNAFAERWVLSCKSERTRRILVIGEDGVWRAIQEFIAHYHTERPHQGLGNVVPTGLIMGAEARLRFQRPLWGSSRENARTAEDFALGNIRATRVGATGSNDFPMAVE